MSKPSILLINRVYPPTRGATGRLLQDVARALEQSGWHVTVLATGDKADIDVQQNITIHRVKAAHNGKSALGYMANWRRLYKAAMKQPRHDVVLTVTDPPLVLLIGAALARKKKMAHVHCVRMSIRTCSQHLV